MTILSSSQRLVTGLQGSLLDTAEVAGAMPAPASLDFNIHFATVSVQTLFYMATSHDLTKHALAFGGLEKLESQLLHIS